MNSIYPLWNEPSAKPVLARNAVHIWRATTETPDRNLAWAESVLSSDERARADRFVFERDHHRFVVARGLLRSILSLYLDCTPSELQFSYSEHGKPLLGGSHVEADFNFNLAHSGTLALYAVTLRRAIGVDLERVLHDIDVLKIAHHFFSPDETRQLLAVPVNSRARAFYKCWTCKEAFIKASGMGLLFPLNQFSVSFYPAEGLRLETTWDMNESSRWSLKAVDVSPDYAATVVVEGHDWQPRYWQVNSDIFRD